MICSQSTTLSQVEGFDYNGNFDMDGRIKSRIYKVTVIGALLSFCFLPHKDIDVAAIAIFQHGTRRVCNKNTWPNRLSILIFLKPILCNSRIRNVQER